MSLLPGKRLKNISENITEILLNGHIGGYENVYIYFYSSKIIDRRNKLPVITISRDGLYLISNYKFSTLFGVDTTDRYPYHRHKLILDKPDFIGDEL